MNWFITTLVGVVGAIALIWALFMAGLFVAKPSETTIKDAVRLLPDLIRLLSRLATDRSQPRGIRIRLWLLLAYLASPIDLVPDFIPVIGYADDAVVLALVLRSVARRAGQQVIAQHWPGTDEGLRTLCQLAGIPLAK